MSRKAGSHRCRSVRVLLITKRHGVVERCSDVAGVAVPYIERWIPDAVLRSQVLIVDGRALTRREGLLLRAYSRLPQRQPIILIDDGSMSRAELALIAVDYVIADLLIIDDFGLDAMDATESRDAYDIFTERHRSGSIVVTSNRGPDEWLATFADPVRAQSAIDRFTTNSYDLVMEGESYRRRLKPKLPSRQDEVA
jgi:hypothetical protein